MSAKRAYSVLLVALFVSGASGLVNQIAWQRAVKVYLGNNESLSSMIVVLVFMLGLGLGSLVAAKQSGALKNPFRALGLIEVGLCLINGILIFVFGEELRRYGYALQAAAIEAHIPTSLLYAVLSFVVLIVPCFLMGLTIPVAAEAAQRQLQISKQKAVSHFFFLNTIGAVLGTLGCGLLLMPVFGQKLSLVFAAGGNLVAALLILFLLAGLTVSPGTEGEQTQQHSPPPLRQRLRSLQNEEVLAFTLGALSLGYEIFLFRLVALAYTPLPWVFSVVLCCFLLFWSFGVALSEVKLIKTLHALCFTAIAIAIIPLIFKLHQEDGGMFPIWGMGLLYFVPCIGFGLLFGLTISRYAKQWGRDVGLFTALNTFGSGVGIVVTTFVLFEIDKDMVAWVLTSGLLLFVPYFYAKENPGFGRSRSYAVGVALLGCWLLLSGLRGGPVKTDRYLEFNGRDGVVMIDRDARVYIDGLWHSVLYRDDDRAAKNGGNVRRKMLIALLPFLAHSGTGQKSVLNIGMGTGATARTLAKSTTVDSVDAYEIVTTVHDVIAQFPAETLGTNQEKVRVFWEDARAGMVHRTKKYDIITQSPLYLKQAGSSFLLSREYFELVKSRLKEGGIAGIYCNAQGNQEQALLVRKTVSSVFAHYESFGDGYFILASMQPIQITAENFNAKLVSGDPIVDDIRILGVDQILQQFDRPRLDWDSSPYLVTDDHPLVEHPDFTRWLFRWAK